jgi:hypothetical protein
VATTAAPAFRASSGKISGIGLAQANTIALGAIVATISGFKIFAMLTPTKTSIPSMPSFKPPLTLRLLVFCAKALSLSLL